MTKLLDNLNNKQKEAVLQTEGPVLILAGAGSGKTRALTFRVADLIREKKIPPKNILAVTFTNKAAGEMMERVKELLGLPKETPPFSQYLPHIGTFHSTCVRILRREIEKMGYKKNFVIYDDQDQLALMKRVMKELEIPGDEVKPQAILGTISNAKNKLIDANQFEEQSEGFYEERVTRCYKKYAKELKDADALDFDDLILVTVKLFQKYPEVLAQYQELFKYIMVDEYQDTNHAQYTLLKILAESHHNICVVGDDWQSIYGWRGADVQNILDFEKDYPDAKVVMLEQNYRSTQNILDAAHCVISKNVNRKDKKLWTDNDQGNLLTLFEAVDEKDEAQFVVDKIIEIQKEEKDPVSMGTQDPMSLRLDDFAILYRTNAQSRALEEAFLKADIPYRIIGGIKFYQRKEIKDILAYLYLLVNPKDKISFIRAVNMPARGLGEKTVAKVLALTEKFNGDILRTIEKLDSDVEVSHALPLQVNKIKTLQEFAQIIKKLQKFSKKNKPSKVIEEVYERSGYKKMLEKMGDEGAIRAENVMELLTVANKYDDMISPPAGLPSEALAKDGGGDTEGEGAETGNKTDQTNYELRLPAGEAGITNYENALSAFLEEVALVSQVDRDLEENDSVPMMTLHAAKGLEFESVFMVGMEEGLFPHSRATFNEKEMEEERRLCYVGITRAKQKAHLLYTTARNIYGSTQISIKSRFIDEIDDGLYEEQVSETEEFRFLGGNDRSARSRFGTNKDEMPVFHEEKTINLDSASSNAKAEESTVVFEQNFKDGGRVAHEKFGEGIVVAQDEATVSVAFPGTGVKKLAKGVAPLKKM